MTPTQAENLRILIRHMETNVKRKLDMRRISNHECGTPACAWGEACMVPALQHELGTLAGRKPLGIWSAFGVLASGALFGFSLNGKSDVSPHEWATAARKHLAKSGYTMEPKDDGFAAFRAKIMKPLDVSVTTEHGTALFPK